MVDNLDQIRESILNTDFDEYVEKMTENPQNRIDLYLSDFLKDNEGKTTNKRKIIIELRSEKQNTFTIRYPNEFHK